MNKLYDLTAESWRSFATFGPLLGVMVWMAADSLWDSYSRRKNYEELLILNDLREKNAITQKEFEDQKERLLST